MAQNPSLVIVNGTIVALGANFTITKQCIMTAYIHIVLLANVLSVSAPPSELKVLLMTMGSLSMSGGFRSDGDPHSHR